MNNSKTSYTLCSSSSQSQKVRCPVAHSTLTEKLYLARQKLLPLIDNVMKAANDKGKQSNKAYYLTLEQYEDVIWASQILKEVDEICANVKSDKRLKRSYNVNNFDLEKNHAKISKQGRVHVDTSILIQMIELHNTLGDIINHVQTSTETTTTSNDVSSYTQTEESSNMSEKYDPPGRKRVPPNEKLNVVISVNKNGSLDVSSRKVNAPNATPIRKPQISKRTQIGCDGVFEETATEKKKIFPPSFLNEIIVMPARTSGKEVCRAPCSKNLSSLPEERISNSEVKLANSKQPTRKTKSAGSLDADDEAKSKVTDAAGARDIIVKCITDLNKIRSYFEMESVDVGVTAEIQIQRSTVNQKQGTRPQSKEDFKNCTCIGSGPIEVPVEELLDKDGTASKLIICIKGKTEEEDVQIVIRRCSDCKNVEVDGSADRGDDSNEQDNSPPASDSNDEGHPLPERSCSVTFDTEEARRNGINILFDPNDPSKSVVKTSPIPCPYRSSESGKLAATKRSSTPPCPYASTGSQSRAKSSPKIPCPYLSGTSTDECKSDCPCPAHSHRSTTSKSQSDNDQSDPTTSDGDKFHTTSESCSRIKLYETTNLCFATEDGQELIISLTIKPKLNKPGNLSLKDIFSDSSPDVRNSRKKGSKLDRVIPLARTKVCSSLEFDVEVMETNMRSNGINHLNPNIVVRLKELGVNNLLRACRPVKCGRPAVLNETICKCLPYSASLLSLPLDDDDANIISQSLNMSLNKIKQSNILFKEKIDKVCYTRCENSNGKKDCKSMLQRVLNTKDMYKLKRTSKDPSAEKNLQYYINLVHDADSVYKEQTYEIMFFEIKRYDTTALQNSETASVNNEEGRPESQATNQPRADSSHGELVTIPNTHKVNDLSDFTRNINSFLPKMTGKKLANRTTNILQLPSPIQKSEEMAKGRKRVASRIPIYKYHPKSNSNHKADLDCDSDIYDISLHSLPREGSSSTEGGKIKQIQHVDKSCDEKENNFKIISPPMSTKGKVTYETSSPSTSCSERTCILVREDNKTNNTDKQRRVRLYDSPYSFELYFNDCFQPTKSGRTLNQKHSSKLLKKRKKKSQFRLASTRSGTYQSISNNKLRSVIIESDNASSLGKNGDVAGLRDEDIEDDIDFQEVMCSFKSAFYEYLIRNAFLESKHNILRNVNSTSSLSSCREGMSNKDLKTVFHAAKQRIIEEVGTRTPTLLSQPNVEAGMDKEEDSRKVKMPILKLKSRENSVKSSGGRAKRTRYFDNKSCRMKRSSLLPSYVRSTKSFHACVKRAGISKGCQISDRCFNEMKTILEKNKDIIRGNLASCDTFENFIVTFDSTTSTNVSSERKVSFEDILADYIKYSLKNKTPGTGKGLEGVIKIMEANSWLEMGVEPVRYFVYQNAVEQDGEHEDPDAEGERNEKTKVKKGDKLYCGCPSKSAQKPKKEKQCKVCGCLLAPPVSAISKCSNCLRNITKEATDTFKSCVKRASEKRAAAKRQKSAGVMCVPQCEQKGVGTAKGNKGNCRCQKCDKFDKYGNCSCSHCLKHNDKSVSAKARCKDHGTQCICEDHSPSAPPPDDHAPNAPPPDDHAPRAPPQPPRTPPRDDHAPGAAPLDESVYLDADDDEVV